MAETTPVPNNKSVNYGIKPTSEHSTAVVKPSKPRARKSAKRAIKHGMISEKAAKRNFEGSY